MSHRARSLVLALFTLAASSIATASGCGPTVDGSQSSGGSTGVHAGSCSTPDVVGEIESCPEADGSCGGGSLCDEADNRWTADCTKEGCKCLFNGEEICACTFEEQVCFDSQDTLECCAALNEIGCCPHPWIQFPGCKAVGESCAHNDECCTYLCTDGGCEP
jgi:hypothetical protein